MEKLNNLYNSIAQKQGNGYRMLLQGGSQKKSPLGFINKELDKKSFLIKVPRELEKPYNNLSNKDGFDYNLNNASHLKGAFGRFTKDESKAKENFAEVTDDPTVISDHGENYKINESEIELGDTVDVSKGSSIVESLNNNQFQRRSADNLYWINQAKKYGFKDMDEVSDFQRKNGLYVDGKVGKKTINKLKLINSNKPQSSFYVGTPEDRFSYVDANGNRILTTNRFEKYISPFNVNFNQPQRFTMSSIQQKKIQ